MIKKLIKYGTVAAVSFELGSIAQTHYLNYKAKGEQPTSDVDVWKGEKSTLEIPVQVAESINNELSDVIADKDFKGAIFEEEDLRDVRAKISHALSDVPSEPEQTIEIELADRKRLRAIDAWDAHLTTDLIPETYDPK